MLPSRTDKLLWLWLALPLVLFGALAFAFWASTEQEKHRTPPRLTSGPFTLSAWLLPPDYDSLQLVQLVEDEGVGLAVTEAGLSGPRYGSGSFAYGGQPGSLLRLAADGAGQLEVVETHTHCLQNKPLMLTHDGRALYMTQSRSPALTLPSPPAVLEATLAPLPDALSRTKLQFDTGLSWQSLYWFTMLSPSCVALLDDATASGSQARPWIVHGGQPADGGATITQAAACGDVWLGWPSLGVLAHPGQLYVLDKAREQFTERPELAALAARALADTPRIRRFAYSDGCMVTQSLNHDALRLYAADGSTFTIKVVDPQRQNPDGSTRLLPPGGLASLLPGGGNSYLAALHALRAEGRTAPLSVVSGGQGDNDILPIGDGRFVLLDESYDRLTVIECKGQP